MKNGKMKIHTPLKYNAKSASLMVEWSISEITKYQSPIFAQIE